VELRPKTVNSKVLIRPRRVLLTGPVASLEYRVRAVRETWELFFQSFFRSVRGVLPDVFLKAVLGAVF
jgi:hypothetical protein